jgi:hypothetical protein
MSQLYISRSHVRKSLMRATTTRLWVTLASPLVALGILAAASPDMLRNPLALAAAIVAVPLIVFWIATMAICRPAVKCPNCENSLWGIGTLALKPNDTKIKDDVNACPYCGAVFI